MSILPKHPLSAAALVAFALSLAPAAAPLAAYWGVDVFRGSHCNPSHFNGETEDWAYEGANLVNNGASVWDVLVANCPVNAKPMHEASNTRLWEIRVVVHGADFSNGWCTLVDWNGVERTMNRSTTNPEWFWWSAPVNTGIHSRDFTVECLVLKDWALERIEVIWNW